MNQSNECIDDSNDEENETGNLNEELKLSFDIMKSQFMNFVVLFVSSRIH